MWMDGCTFRKSKESFVRGLGLWWAMNDSRGLLVRLQRIFASRSAQHSRTQHSTTEAGF